MTQSSALVVFARTPQVGATKTRLQPLLGDEGALAAHVELVETTLVRLASIEATRSLWVTAQTPQTESWAASHGYDHAVQASGDLGQRMAGVFRNLFDDGYDAVCLVGTDCPTVDTAYVQDAFAALCDADLVLGPAEDGGYGLVALNKMPVTRWRPVFQDIAWGTADVLEATIARAAKQGLRVVCLPEIWDVDVPADWQRYLRWRDQAPRE